MGMLTEEASAAFAEVQRKVAELQDAICRLDSIYESNVVGLQEWCDSLDDTMDELATEMFESED